MKRFVFAKLLKRLSELEKLLSTLGRSVTPPHDFARINLPHEMLRQWQSLCSMLQPTTTCCHLTSTNLIKHQTVPASQTNKVNYHDIKFPQTETSPCRTNKDINSRNRTERASFPPFTTSHKRRITLVR